MDVEHKAVLAKLCRVCGHLLTRPGKMPRGYSCTDLADQLLRTFSVDVKQDTCSVNPGRFCHSCHKGVGRKEAANKEGKEFNSSTRVVDWCEHNDNCRVCFVRGGRPKKKSKPGRPPSVSYTTITPSVSYTTIIDHLQNLERESTLPSPVDLVTLYDQELSCRICLNKARCPIELTACQALVCASCCVEWLATSKSFACPCCYSDHLRDLSTVRLAGPILRMVLEPNEEHHTFVASMLYSDVSKPLSPLEERILAALVKRSISQSHGNVLRVKTGGHV